MSSVVGLAYEGNRDLETIKIIILRLAEDFEQDFVFSEHRRGINNAHTAIVPYVKTFTGYMFDEAEVDFAFYFTDQDDDANSRRRQILSKIEEVGITYFEKSFVGVPIPHFEAWLICDEDIVKSVLHYDHTKPLPYSDMRPKERLQALVQNSSVNILLEDAKIQIAQRMSFENLCRAQVGFKEFYTSFRRFFNQT